MPRLFVSLSHTNTNKYYITIPKQINSAYNNRIGVWLKLLGIFHYNFKQLLPSENHFGYRYCHSIIQTELTSNKMEYWMTLCSQRAYLLSDAHISYFWLDWPIWKWSLVWFVLCLRGLLGLNICTVCQKPDVFLEVFSQWPSTSSVACCDISIYNSGLTRQNISATL